ncbi:hypothetical protein DPMN_068358 [Dreissena polymorpha]|uniref:Uncharacterized protein n=1 Tax=Dreissena polymorpha TaxID=45954 RepID=A0A9D3Z2E2_DREPO|nr:hypothetical protein DPMN_068358 [Dreissena polymorpha]
MPRCSRPYSGDVVKPLSTYGQLPFRLAILASFGSQQSQRERTPSSSDDVTIGIRRAARRSSPIRHFSDDVVKPLSTYGELPFLSAILRSRLQENLLRVTLAPVATFTVQVLTEVILRDM